MTKNVEYPNQNEEIFSFLFLDNFSIIEPSFLYPMLMKCREHLHPIIDFKGMLLTKIIFDQDCNLDILEQTTSILGHA